jgi:hypothetical protein
MTTRILDPTDVQKTLIPIAFSSKIWFKLLDFWQLNIERMEELSGIQRHWLIPLVGDPAMEKSQWLAIRQAILHEAKVQNQKWLVNAAQEIERALNNWKDSP